MIQPLTTPEAQTAPNSIENRIDLVGLSKAELKTQLTDIGEPAFRAKQLWHWIYHRGETDFDQMTTIAKSLRAILNEKFIVRRPGIALEQTSNDKSRKWLFKFHDGNEAETVFIPEEDRGAVCISSQVGCSLSCTFCHTGTMDLVRNLTAGEIVGQMMAARDSYNEWPSPSGDRLLSNIVMMGMGEPLINYENVAKALTIIMDGEGIAISKRRITLSTSGLVPMMDRCGSELGVNLAVSLHAVTDELRDVLVPINKKYPIKELLDACRRYPSANNARRITFEYVMLKGVNDSQADARELVRMAKGIPVKFNLIPFNPWPGVAYDCSTMSDMKRFSEILNDGGFSAPIRVPRGRDILAACGQLKSASKRDVEKLKQDARQRQSEREAS
ncbi:MAG: 23S rRNA (adenine(2503)-C(2))-methyltransferase RlmN [Rhodospirillales bacterium]|jgi:23S rRNA (adenine2503-C2)-methyltransferase|nr:23S rRNA (adenine(2503)-C(2))-methyltransferase RlmN [Rhodospirillales bacterium]